MWKYPNYKIFPYHVYPTIWLEYFCAIGIIGLIPLDLTVTIIGRKSIGYYEANIHVLINMYKSLFWSGQILSNIILVFQELYNCSGYFTFKDKCKDVFKQTIIQIIIVIVIGSIFFGILVGENVIEPNIDAVLLVTIIMTNTLGLTFLMMLLGYGFIIFPIRMWENGSYSKQLNNVQHKASILYQEMRDDSVDISLCVANVLKTAEYLKKMGKFETEIEELMALSPPEFTAKKAGEIAVDKDNHVTLKSLANLKYRLIEKKSNYYITEKKVKLLEEYAWSLEDIIDTINSEKDIIEWTIQPSHQINKKMEYVWYVKVKPILFKILSVLFFVTSFFSFLGVIGSIKGVPLKTSVYFVILHANNVTGAGIVIFTLLTLGYACYVTLWALHEMKIAGIMELVDRNGTWPVSMSFHARMVARLVAPLVFFYLGWIHENENIRGNFANNTNGDQIFTAFSKFYQIQVVPILGNSFSTFFPIFMLCVSFLTATNVLNRLLVFLKLEKYQFGKTFISETVLADGKKRLNDKKKLAMSEIKRKNFSAGIKKIEVKNPMFQISVLENFEDIDPNDLEVGNVSFHKPSKLLKQSNQSKTSKQVKYPNTIYELVEFV